jgi:hypothetical protein
MSSDETLVKSAVSGSFFSIELFMLIRHRLEEASCPFIEVEADYFLVVWSQGEYHWSGTVQRHWFATNCYFV